MKKFSTYFSSTCYSSFPVILLASSLLSLTACARTMDRLEQVGSPPALRTVANPAGTPEHNQVSWPMPKEEVAPTKYANSLWEQGSRTFFRDQRASRVGDILKVTMNLKDKGKLESSTDRTRSSNEEVGIGAMFGLQKIIPGQGGVNGELALDGASKTKGDGQIERKEEIETQLAATVTQMLANGNMVIDGRQEIRINNEIREISVQGVVRPQDIGSDNSIDYSQVAEARISYGGRGQISELQGPRWGHEIVETLSPF